MPGGTNPRLTNFDSYGNHNVILGYNLKKISPYSYYFYDFYKGAFRFVTFLYGDAVCQGYSELMDIFLKTMGYETVLVNAYSEDFDFTNDGHAWNIIKINKKWYAVDTTWNDGQKDSAKYLLVSQKEMKDHNGWALGNYKDYTLSKTRLSKNSTSKLKLTY